jgi:hypothetical protein
MFSPLRRAWSCSSKSTVTSVPIRLSFQPRRFTGSVVSSVTRSTYDIPSCVTFTPLYRQYFRHPKATYFGETTARFICSPEENPIPICDYTVNETTIVCVAEMAVSSFEMAFLSSLKNKMSWLQMGRDENSDDRVDRVHNIKLVMGVLKAMALSRTQHIDRVVAGIKATATASRTVF